MNTKKETFIVEKCTLVKKKTAVKCSSTMIIGLFIVTEQKVWNIEIDVYTYELL